MHRLRKGHFRRLTAVLLAAGLLTTTTLPVLADPALADSAAGTAEAEAESDSASLDDVSPDESVVDEDNEGYPDERDETATGQLADESESELTENESPEDIMNGEGQDPPENPDGDDSTDPAVDDEMDILPYHGLPIFDIRLADGVTLDHLNQSDKCYGYGATTVSIVDEADETACQDFSDVEIKGRGNWSWRQPKKPYQLKFNKKVSLYGLPKSKKYVLLANYCDPTLMRNAVTFDLAATLGLSPSAYRFIDLYINGEYLGNYMLCQKVEAGSNSLDLQDENGVIAEISNHLKKCQAHPEENDVYGEMSYVPLRYTGEPCTARTVSLKDAVSKDEVIVNQAFGDLVERISWLEEAADQGNWEAIASAIDVESFAGYYLMSELTGNIDAQRSSCYIYRDGYDDVLHAGPMWDLEIAYGNYFDKPTPYNLTDYALIYNDPMGPVTRIYSNLMKIEEFRAVVRQLWEDKLLPAIENEYDRIDELAATLEESAMVNNAQWALQDFPEAVTNLKTFIRAKTEFLKVFLSPSEHLENGSYRFAVGDDAYLSINGIDSAVGSTIFNVTALDGGSCYLIQDYLGNVLSAVNTKNELNPTSTLIFDEAYLSSENDVTDEQKWLIVKCEDGTYELVSRKNGMCIGVGGTGMAYGSKAQSFTAVEPVRNAGNVVEGGAVLPEYLSGQGRYETAAAIARMAFKGEQPETVVLVTGQNFPDALAANGYAGALEAPLLLTKTSQLSKETEALLREWPSVKKVVIVGQTMQPAVIRKLQALGITDIEIIGGSNRYETAVRLCQKGIVRDLYSRDYCFVATAADPADALSAATWCYQQKIPVLLTKKNGTVDEATAEMLALFKEVYVLGGESCVSTKAMASLGFEEGVNMTRLSGTDRYATSLAIAEAYLEKYGGDERASVVLAKGASKNFPDALSGGMLGKHHALTVTLLTKAEAPTIYESIRSLKQGKGISRTYVLGAAAQEADILIRIQNALR
ncbi:MAG: CotH kinase family protein [Lachnospiraceae bacterium]|nr:CotH kinase family protein [Lachnospiraceae bacterium]